MSTPPLPADVRELLAAVVDALDVPLPDITDTDQRAYNRLIRHRACDVRSMLQVLLEFAHLEFAHPALRTAALIRERTAEEPITYTPWQAPAAAVKPPAPAGHVPDQPSPVCRDDSDATTREAIGAVPADTPRCPAAHPDDPTPCGGPPAVSVLDARDGGADGCEHHAARLLASLTGGRVDALPGAPDGAAIRVSTAADGIRPFPWLTDAPRTGPDRLSHRENREG